MGISELLESEPEIDWEEEHKKFACAKCRDNYGAHARHEGFDTAGWSGKEMITHDIGYHRFHDPR